MLAWLVIVDELYVACPSVHKHSSGTEIRSQAVEKKFNAKYLQGISIAAQSQHAPDGPTIVAPFQHH